MKYLRVGALVGMAAALLSLVVNCNDRDVSQITGDLRDVPDLPVQEASDRCVPGQTFACMGGCGQLGSGYQVCADDGRSYGPCICPPLRILAPLPSARGDGERRVLPRTPLVGGALARPASGGSGGTPANPAGGEGVVGAACTADRDCLDGLNCLTAAAQSLGVSGGPAGGYCSRSCGGDADCQQIDPGSECIGFAGNNVCVRRCASGAPAPGESKCLSRTDVMCISVVALGQEPTGTGPQPGFCVPACQSDAQCGPGLVCDLGNGLCTSLPPEGAPVGSVCTAPEECASGVCLPLNPALGLQSFCSGFCRVGSPGCGFDGSEAQAGATCLFPQVQSEGEGDRGLCFEACDVASDCREPGAVCLAQASSGRAGVCVVPEPDEAPPDEPAIGNGCRQDADCGAGLSCLTQDSDPFGVGGGPAGGYCTAPCPDGVCPEAGARCVGTPGGNICLRGCDPTTGDDCGGRDALLCTEFAGGADPTRGFCAPQCTADEQCGDRACNPVLGLCVDAPVAECAQDEDCGPDEVCETTFGVCEALPPDCSDDEDCDSGECDFDSGSCVEPEPECTEDSDCEDGVCDTELGLCVDATVCTSDEDCETGSCDLDAGICVPSEPECSTDADCLPGACDTDLGVCVEVPACTLDSDCEEGVCNQSEALCRDAPEIPIGGACEQHPDCAGELCGSFDGVTSFCTGFCLLATEMGCERYGSDAVCLQDDSDDLVVGICFQLCDTAPDCNTSGFVCEPIGGTFRGRVGLCLPPLP